MGALKEVSKIADQATKWAGTPEVIIISVVSIGVFILIGIPFGFSQIYQIVVNTFLSAVSYTMLFVIQHTQNREGKVLQLKLDELLRSHKNADSAMIAIERLSDDELDALIKERQEIVDKIKKKS